MKSFRSSWAAILLVALAARVAAAAEPASLRAKIDALAEPLVQSETVVGLAIGIVDNGKMQVFGYGRLSDASPKPPDGKTLFEIGSITKVFTGLLLADMPLRKQVALDDPVAQLLPEPVKLPQRSERPITLLDLATHTSGLPRLPGNFFAQMAKNPGNPYANYTVEQLYESLPKDAAAGTPGAKYAYSNLGMGLLGHVLARRAGTSYETLVAERISGPLGMKDTSIALSEDQRRRLAPGHDLDGNALANWDIPTLAGAGALRSTVDDLLKFVAANLQPEKTPLSAAIETAQKPRHEISKRSESIALGWHIRSKQAVYWHNGQTGGYHGLVAFERARGTGVVVLSNSGVGVVDELGFRILRVLAGEQVEPLKVRMPVRLDPATLEQYVGKYELYPTFVLSVFRQGDRLLVQATNQPRLRIYPESATKFFYRAVDAEITFVRDEQGKFNKLILHQHGLDLPAWRGGVAVEAAKGLLKLLRPSKK